MASSIEWSGWGRERVLQELALELTFRLGSNAFKARLQSGHTSEAWTPEPSTLTSKYVVSLDPHPLR